MQRLFLLLIVYHFNIFQGISQNNKQEIFTVSAFLEQVKKYHPVAQQANILVDKANAALLGAKGGFDPAVQLHASRKTFDGKNYYFYTNPELVIPLPVGNIKTGIENNGGDNIISESTKGRSGYLGIEIPLAKGLILDNRRAVLQQANLFQKQSSQERLIILNNLFFNSYNAYWQWAASYMQHKVYSKFTEIAHNRLRLVRIAFLNGDRAMVDTIEAFTQIQSYLLLQTEALLQLNNAKLELENYLWLEGYSNYQLPDNYTPDSLQFTNLNTEKNLEVLLARSAAQNPVLQIYNFKQRSLELERKLKFQSLLPYFSVKANLLNKDFYVLKNMNSGFIQNNYKWGIDFKIPLFLREARGDYKMAQLKIEEIQLDFKNKQRQTENKIRSYYNEYNVLSTQLQTTQKMYNNYQSLLRSEELKFAQGETSLFMVNSRETKLIELLQKQIELTSKYYKAAYALEWAAGIIE